MNAEVISLSPKFALNNFLFSGLVLPLLIMTNRSENGSLDLSQVPFANFADYYRKYCHMFITGCENSDEQVTKITQIYVMVQITPIFDQFEGDNEFDAVNDAVESSIAANVGDVTALLEEQYPAELAEIIANNKRFYERSRRGLDN